MKERSRRQPSKVVQAERAAHARFVKQVSRYLDQVERTLARIERMSNRMVEMRRWEAGQTQPGRKGKSKK